jgi:hypothetical protein
MKSSYQASSKLAVVDCEHVCKEFGNVIAAFRVNGKSFSEFKAKQAAADRQCEEVQLSMCAEAVVEPETFCECLLPYLDCLLSAC